MEKTNLERLWDEKKLCSNPHKGWHHHYYDNSLKVYGPLLKPDDFLTDFPGLNHIYLRVDWSHLEPAEGRYDWEVIDRIIGPWTAHGYGVSFRICCKETWAGFATPEWVMKAGARGTFYPMRDGPCWEPDYGDPIFLEKLEQFHRVFGQRYGSQPWLEFVDVGSYGEWGEGHTQWSGKKDWPVEALKKHIDIHIRSYPNTFVLMNDDTVTVRGTEEGRDEILDYAVSKGLGLRDDSVCVNSYAEKFGFSTLRYPEIFNPVWRTKPVDMELDHYHSVIEYKRWHGGLPLLKAVEETHASYVGFHGDARKWLAENSEIAPEIANRSGYWYFPKSIELDRTMARGRQHKVKLVWENHGVAPAYYRYKLTMRLSNESGAWEQELADSDCRKWMPDEIVSETHWLKVPESLEPGTYRVGVALYDPKRGRDIAVGLKDAVKAEGFWNIAEVAVVG